ncbi:MAG: hypothetical protein A2077_06055 [Nitrospirae bacterium GWC2_46_6]|nr:MAG: hypothetical protein A2077_06055 [Nitrospirae bacterium GWC2_46_6]OGW20137.1 MAG: hypothetical protein A2Z82_10715 [Nitrospirae bacterium GWA2_46_11]OGW22786.1 MAG: hypothetical protein A2X55_02570 [Nitrospirae bacterium GWB2_47_37]HAK89798.1 hypothetical protein [Nitrospiraceae bacterium]
MKLRTGPVPGYILVVVCLISVIFMYMELTVEVKSYAPYYDKKKKAAILTQKLFTGIKDIRAARGLPIDHTNDPNGTGIIGVRHSEITTEAGDLNAKLTTTNPNFAAMIIDILIKAGVREKDVIAVSFSGSFPALNLMTIAAIETLDLEPIIITSVGSSMWGANEPEFTYPDMEKALFDAGLIKHRTDYASIGGVDDTGRGLSIEGRDLIMDAIYRNKLPEIEANGLNHAIKTRIGIYKSLSRGKDIKAFVNIGGGAAALAGVNVDSGIVDPRKFSGHPGLVGEFLRTGIAVVNIEDIKNLSRKYNLPFAPAPLPEIGAGKIFYEMRHSVVLASIFALILVLILFVILRLDMDYYLRALIKRHK